MAAGLVQAPCCISDIAAPFILSMSAKDIGGYVMACRAIGGEERAADPGSQRLPL